MSGPSEPGRALAGFLLSGFLMALLGAVLPAWGYHRDQSEFAVAGVYFLCIAAGLVGSAAVGRRLVPRMGASRALVFACGLAAAALIFLALASPPRPAWWRAAGLLAVGLSGGLLNMALFDAISSGYHSDPARAVIRGGIWHGLGCLAVTLLVAGTFYAYSVQALLGVMALAPAGFTALYARSRFPATRPSGEPSLREAAKAFRSPGAVLFALLLFFQFGNEWSLAGWLPLFLIRRVGMSLEGALLILALYWFFLLAGRLVSAAILPRVKHGRLLLGSAVSALFGCLILYLTKTGFGAASGAFFIGAGYASVYPLVAEAIGRRFPYYHPGFFNGIFSLALLGGLLAPASLGYAAAKWGVGVVVGIPLLGTCMVTLLIPAIWLESKLTGE